MTKSTAVASDSANRRKKRRYYISGVGRLVAPFADVECHLHDISEHGARVKADVDVRIDDMVALEIEGIGCLRGQVIRADDNEVAIEFDFDQPRQKRLTDKIRAFILGISETGN